MIKKFLVCLLVVAMLLLPLVSCASGNGDDTQKVASTTATEVTQSEADNLFPKKDYNEASFRVYYRTQNSAHYKGLYIIPEEDSADVLDEVAESRNMMVEDRYNVKIEPNRVENPARTIANDIAGGESTYDVVLTYRNDLGPLALSGYLYNMRKLDIDYNTAWWDSNAARDYTMSGRLYITINDVSINNICNINFFYFNKQVLSDFNLTSPYEYVQNNKWTIDTLFEMMKVGHSEASDGGVGVFACLGMSRNYMLTGCGVIKLEQDADGNVVSNLCNYIDRASTFFDKFDTIYNDKEIHCDYSRADALDPEGAAKYNDMFVHARTMFAENHFLFAHTDLDAASREFIDMPKGFGLVPNPKFDTDQERYYHQVDPNALAWCVPAFSDLDFEMISDVFDYWAYASHSTLMESFYESSIKVKRSSDPTTAGMIDIIKGSCLYFISDIYEVGGVDALLSAANNGSFVSKWKSSQTTVSKSLQKLQQRIEKIDD